MQRSVSRLGASSQEQPSGRVVQGPGHPVVGRARAPASATIVGLLAESCSGVGAPAELGLPSDPVGRHVCVNSYCGSLGTWVWYATVSATCRDQNQCEQTWTLGLPATGASLVSRAPSDGRLACMRRRCGSAVSHAATSISPQSAMTPASKMRKLTASSVACEERIELWRTRRRWYGGDIGRA